MEQRNLKGREGPQVCAAPPASILARQQERGDASVGLGDYPERIVAKALARPGIVDRIGGEDSQARLDRFAVGSRVLFIDAAPVAAGMAIQATVQMPWGTGFERSGRGDDLS